MKKKNLNIIIAIAVVFVIFLAIMFIPDTNEVNPTGLTDSQVGDTVPEYLALEGDTILAPNIDEPFSLADFFGSLAFFSGEEAINSKCARYSWSEPAYYSAYGRTAVGTECLDGQFVVPFYTETGNIIFSEIWYKSNSRDTIDFYQFFTRSQNFEYHYGCYNCVQLQIEAQENGCLTEDKSRCVSAIDSDCDERYIYNVVCQDHILQDECVIGEKQCTGNILQVCGSKDGYNQWITAKTCDYQCESGSCIEEPSYCGDGTCDADESQTSCSDDCGLPPPNEYCGDGSCNNGETKTTCPDDCGTPPPDCDEGDSRCVGTSEERCLNDEWVAVDGSTTCSPPPPTCDDGDVKCFSGNVNTCVAGSFQITEECSEICANTPEGAECVGGDNIIDKIKEWWSKQTTTNQYLLGGLGLAIILFGLYFAFKPKSSGGL